MKSTDNARKPPSAATLFWVWITGCVFLAIQFFIHKMYLYGDTPWDLHASLSQGKVVWEDYARWAGKIHRVWPVLLNSLFGINETRLLVFSYGASAAILPILSGLLSWSLVRRAKPQLILLLIWSHLFALAETYPYSYVENYVAFAAFWPLVFLLVTNYRGVFRVPLLIVLSLCSFFAYECNTLFYFPVLMWLIFISGTKSSLHKSEKIFLFLIATGGAIASIRSLLIFRPVLNNSGVIREVFAFDWLIFQPTLVLGALLLLTMIVFIRAGRGAKILAATAMALCLVKMAMVVRWHQNMYDPYLQWNVKALTYLLPPLLVFFAFHQLLNISTIKFRTLSYLSMLYLGVMIGFVLMQARDWSRYLEIFNAELAKGGVIRDAETPFFPPESRTTVTKYHCSSFASSLSIFLQAIENKPVSAFVLSGYDENPIPWDPRNEQIALANLDIKIDPELEAFLALGPHKKIYGPAPAL